MLTYKDIVHAAEKLKEVNVGPGSDERYGFFADRAVISAVMASLALDGLTARSNAVPVEAPPGWTWVATVGEMHLFTHSELTGVAHVP